MMSSDIHVYLNESYPVFSDDSNDREGEYVYNPRQIK